MKGFGWVVLLVGVLWLIVALNMDVSVATGYGRVNNIGLMASRQNHIIVGSVMALCGLLMAILGKRNSEDVGGRVKCPFCAELISEEAIKCKHCGSDVQSLLAQRHSSAFKPSDIPVYEFFVRRKDGFELKDAAIDILVSRLKQANPGANNEQIIEIYKHEIEDLMNQLPSALRDEFINSFASKM